jgi:hypothetical protein
VKLSKAWNPSTRLLRHYNAHGSGNPKKTQRITCYKGNKVIEKRDPRLSDMVIG